jgi:hypothetical protein
VIIRAPEPLVWPEGMHPSLRNPRSVFLAGSIEMGKAEDWQARCEAALGEMMVVLNPRRRDWDSSWVHDPYVGQFKEQVEWELEALEAADRILMYFDPNTTSPITLLELGLYAPTGKLTVCCPPGYFRHGNVIVTCRWYGVPTVPNLDELIKVGMDVV